jgi:uncharacterized membrane protein (DUF106 family)
MDNIKELQEKAVEATKQREEEKTKKPEPEEQEGMPHQRKHCSPEKQLERKREP